jgi:FMN phosphatase YigB (HAD superfamily)
MIKHVIISYENGLMNIKRDFESDRVWEDLNKYFLFMGIDSNGYDLKKNHEKAFKNLSNVGHSDDMEIDMEDVFYKLFKKYDIKAKKKHLRELGVIYQILTTVSIEANVSIKPIIEYCKKNKLALYTIANGQIREIQHELKAVNLNDVFSEVLCSSVSSHKKPNPYMLESLIKKQELKKKETLYISTDYSVDLKMAKDCGVKTALLDNEDKNVDSCGDTATIIKYIKEA